MYARDNKHNNSHNKYIIISYHKHYNSYNSPKGILANFTFDLLTF